jgi:transcriptional pleiotropic repressor
VSSQLLERTRTINKSLQAIGGTNISFDQLANLLGDVLNSNIYILSSKGKLIGLYLLHEKSSALIENPKTNEKMYPLEYAINAMKLNETVDNLTGDELLKIFPDDISGYDKYTTIVPILGSGQRLGTLELARFEEKFSDEDLVIAEYSATIVGLEILKAKGEELEDEMRKNAVVQIAIDSLSYTELEAIKLIFEELNGKDGLVVASKIADRARITRSVTVNALRKFESAGVIESRSLGMKGTHIRILNDNLIDALEKLKNNR